MLAGEVRGELRTALDALPERQRTVITLRDVLGHSSEEVCEMLEISPGQPAGTAPPGPHRRRAGLATYLERS